VVKKIPRWLRAVAIVALCIPIVTAVTAYLVGKATVAPLSGTLSLPALSARVEIVRDAEAVPHIFGLTLDDLYIALGFVHAQDRLWQMELLRRAGQGRLSEIFGERTLGTDIFIRSLDIYGHATRALAALKPQHRASLEAYARGVNAFLDRPTNLAELRWPPELLLLRHRPEPWQPADSIAVLKMMALTLSTNLEHEITRLSYAAQGMTPAEIEDLMPLSEAGGPPLPDIRQLYPLRALPRQQAAADVSESPITGGASNNWVVAGSRTRSGAPLLANDPHLRLGAPSTWFFAHLSLIQPGTAATNVAGASLPGTPLVVLGRSDRIAWGFTNTGADVQDIFVEKINPDNPSEYLTPTGWQRFESERVEIAIKGAAPYVIERRRTRHGPVLPSTYRNLGDMLFPGYVAALRWTALDDDDTTIAAGMFDPRLRTVADYLEHMRAYVVPMQSMVVADVDGHIGMIAPGRLPLRDAQNTVAGRAPVPGWDARYDWKGVVPFEELPRVIDPASGAIGTANASIVPPEYPHLITLDWDTPFRQQRVHDLVVARSGHDRATMQAAQLDVLSAEARRLKPLMISAARGINGVDKPTLDQLAAWDDSMRADAAEPLIYMAWLRELAKAIWADDLGPTFPRFFGPQAPALIRLLESNASGRDWCDDGTTPARESCGLLVSRALTAALADLSQRYGADRRRWTWGPAHVAVNEHRPFGTLPLLASFFNVEVPSPGGPYTLNRGQVDFGADLPFANRGAASCRAIYDLSNLEESLFIHTTGQSGNPFSPFYRSMAERWSKGEYIRIPTARAEIERGAIGTWVLERR
jgi:penicillin amidase